MCTICIEGLPRQFDALLAHLYQQSMLIFATIALDHPKSALESFQWLRRSSRCVLLNGSSSLIYWNLRWTILKPYILPQHHKRLISGIQRIELFPSLSTQREGLRSRLFDYTPHLVSIAAILRIWLFTRSIRFSRTPTPLAENWNLSGF